MELTIGLVIEEDGSCGTYVLCLNKSLYGLKQGSYNWFMKLKNGLEARDLVQSNVDLCVFFGEELVALTYVDNVIIIGDTTKKIDELIQALHGSDENFYFTDNGSIEKYLGVEIKQLGKDCFKFSQPFLIKRVLALLDANKELLTRS